jgi:hypothetical protein
MNLSTLSDSEGATVLLLVSDSFVLVCQLWPKCSWSTLPKRVVHFFWRERFAVWMEEGGGEPSEGVALC